MRDSIKKYFPKEKPILFLWIGLVIIAFILGAVIGGNGDGETHQHEEATAADEVSMWICSMHPHIQQPKPGQCPICGMDLIPVVNDRGDESGPRQLSLSERARKLASVEVASVEKKFVENTIRLVGKIEYDETRISYISSWVPGRIDRMFVNYEGIPVRKGDHLADIYSPELLSTQQEFMESVKMLREYEQQGLDELIETATQQVNSVRERMRLWGLTEEQIKKMEPADEASDHITLYSPVSGIVIRKNALEGEYVNIGTKIYTIADLSGIWVKMDAYESDLPWLRYGQDVEFHTEAYPGEIFDGKIAFIDPVLNATTRTAKIRVNIENPAGKLKPEMFVHAVVRSKIAKGGKVINPDLAGKWISPMHPEIVKNHPGICDLCGMPLVKAEDLGYVNLKNALKEAPLVIPATAPLITGTRSVVYLELPGKEGVYEGREIVLGPRAGDYYIVEEGLKEGEMVVVKGNFKIDSAIQIQAKPSMMNPEGGALMSAHHQHGEMKSTDIAETKQDEKKGEREKLDKFEVSNAFLKQLDAVYAAYYDLQFALSHDKFSPLKQHAAELSAALQKTDMALLKGNVHHAWMDALDKIQRSITELQEAGDMKDARIAFDHLSVAVIYVAKLFGSDEQPLLVYHCPMAFDNRGADWLQIKKGVENPYFGSSMFRCGEQTADLKAPEK